MKPNLFTAEQLVYRQHRRNQYAWPLVGAAVGLSITLAIIWHLHPSLKHVERWGRLPWWWIGGLVVTTVVAGGLYLIRRKSRMQSARAMDARWMAKNRFETVAQLITVPDAIAGAQREETNDFTRQKRLRPFGIPVSYPGWSTALLLLVQLVLLVIWLWPLSGFGFGFHRGHRGSNHRGHADSGEAAARHVTPTDQPEVRFTKPTQPSEVNATTNLLSGIPAEPDHRRLYQLTDEQLAQAPAVYRSAVADYFEELSRDYPAVTNASGK
jgi:hypothetical protein